ncbi:MAG: ABC transporter ATP-binding protein [Pseudomonadota bacterium]
MIAARDLGYRYPRSRGWVFQRLSFDIAAGQIFSILGPNGRGKTTLLKCLVGLITPSEGALHLPENIGYVPQGFATPFAYTAMDIVLMGRARQIGTFGSPRAKDRAMAAAAMADLGIERFANRVVTSLSGGERQMVLIARALASEAPIIILDEPTAALDFRNQSIVLHVLHRLSRERGLTIVMTTHHPQHALEIADAALLLQNDHRHEVGPVEDTLTESHLSDLYGLPVRAAELAHGDHRSTAMIPILDPAHRLQA